MAVSCNLSLFGERFKESKGLDIQEIQESADEKKRLFEKILFETSDSRDVENVPIEMLLQLADMIEFYYGGIPPWEELISGQQERFQSARAVRRTRVL